MIMSREKDIPGYPNRSVSGVVGFDGGLTRPNATGLGFTDLGVATTKVTFLIDAQTPDSTTGTTDRGSTRHDTHRHGGDNGGKKVFCFGCRKMTDHIKKDCPEWKAKKALMAKSGSGSGSGSGKGSGCDDGGGFGTGSTTPRAVLEPKPPVRNAALGNDCRFTMGGIG